MTGPAAPPAAENERSRRTARLEELVRRFGDPFHVTQFAKTHAAIRSRTNTTRCWRAKGPAIA
jgi:hypothetical protein